MTAPLRVGVLGLGKAGQRHVEAANACHDVTLTGVADSAPEARERFDALPSLDALLQSDIEAVILAVPHAALLDASLRSIEAGKHILLEKPMANSLDDAARIVSAARAANVRLMVNYNHRFRDEHPNARRMLAEGAIGEIRFVSAHMFAPVGPLPDWVWVPTAAGGGMMTYSGSHMIDRVMTLVGREVVAVSASAGSFSYQRSLEDTTVACLRFDNDTLASLAQHKSNVSHGEGSWETRFFGSHGAMRITSGEGVFVTGAEREEAMGSGPDRRFECALTELASAIREDREPEPSGAEGLRVRACLDALYSAASSGTWKGLN